MSFIQQRDAEDQVVCIIYDTIMYCFKAVADHLKLPCLNFRTVPASVALLYDSLPMLAAEGHIPCPNSRLGAWFQDFLLLGSRIYQHLIWVVSKMSWRIGFSQMNRVNIQPIYGTLSTILSTQHWLSSSRDTQFHPSR